MNILLIGSGGRENALAWKLSQSNSINLLYAASGNPGIFKFAEKAEVEISDFNKVIEFCKNKNIDLVVIGPEQPLADGMSDALRAMNINVFGPSQYGAQLESSKSFAKNIMFEANVPTAAYQTFTIANSEEAHKYIDLSNMPLVLKADGLAAGKGVIIAENHKQAHSALDEMFSGAFSTAGKNVLIEEFMQGEEASIFAICDGDSYITLAPAQDHKRVLDDDKGKNTGGMGSYAPAPIVTQTRLDYIGSHVIQPILDTMKAKGAPFIGCLYCGLMINEGTIKVVEFNVRFGDPEIQSVLRVFDGDLAGLLYSAAKGKIDKSFVKNVNDGFSACVIMASEGYPDSYEKGYPINGIDSAENLGNIVFHSGTAFDAERNIISAGGRVLGVTSKADSLVKALEIAYSGVDKIDFTNKYYRTDIGRKAIIE